jgi:hypothetical protein
MHVTIEFQRKVEINAAECHHTLMLLHTPFIWTPTRLTQIIPEQNCLVCMQHYAMG